MLSNFGFMKKYQSLGLAASADLAYILLTATTIYRKLRKTGTVAHHVIVLDLLANVLGPI